jgi:molecular chaperone GrpE
MNTEKNDQKKETDDTAVDNAADESIDDRGPTVELKAEEESDSLTETEETSFSSDDDEPDPSKSAPTYEELKSEVEALKDQLLRSLAEGENIRRRTEREKAAITNFARQIISVADNLTRALNSVDIDPKTENEELSNLYIGIEMTDKELTNTFEQFNIKLIDAIGQKFDHNIHQAMFEVDDPDQPAGMVVQEIQKGYLLHDRLLRPAMVGVSKGGPKLEVKEEPKTTQEKQRGNVANDSSSAYEKQSEAANKAAEGNNAQLDKEL